MPPAAPTPINGKICYIEIPALDIRRSADFYAKVFRVAPALGPLASGRVQLGVHESTELREAHGGVAPRLVEQRLRGCLQFPLEGARPGRRCHLHDNEMRVLPGAGNLGEQQV